MIKVCVIGLGFVGSSIELSFKEKNIEVIGYDKFKNGGIGTFKDCLNSDIAFLALPTLYDVNAKKYDKSSLIEVCDLLNQNNYKGLVVIKSTVEPETTDNLAETYKNLNFVHNPEFLTARTAYEDFHQQKHIVLGKAKHCDNDSYLKILDLYTKYYPDAEISECTSNESETMKSFANSFYAVKVQIFNEFYLLCQQNDSDYDKVIEMIIKNGWVNPMHTKVPGPDGQLSYGGACFPKDTNALSKYMKIKNVTHKILSAAIKERNEMRKD